VSPRRVAVLALVAASLGVAGARAQGAPPPLPPPSASPPPSSPPTPAASGALPPLPPPEPSPPPSPPPPPSAPLDPAGAATPSPPPPPVEAPPEDDATKSRLALRGDLGYGFRQLAGRPTHGLDVMLGLGAQDQRFAGYATLEVLVGRTFSDLAQRTVKVGALAEWRLARIVRLGLGGDIGYVFVDRITTDRTMFALGVGVFGTGSVDVYAFGPRGDHAVYVVGRFHGALHFGATQWGPSLGLGFRY